MFVAEKVGNALVFTWFDCLPKLRASNKFIFASNENLSYLADCDPFSMKINETVSTDEIALVSVSDSGIFSAFSFSYIINCYIYKP